MANQTNNTQDVNSSKIDAGALVQAGMGGAGALSTAYSIYGNVKSKEDLMGRINSMYDAPYRGTDSFDSLTQSYLNYSPYRNFTMDEIGFNKGAAGMNVASTALQGAGAGAAFGPWGALVGGLAGLGAGLFGFGAAKRKARKTLDFANSKISEVNKYNLSGLDNRLSNAQREQFGNLKLNSGYALRGAYGGPLGVIEGPIDYSMAMQYLDMKNNAIQNKLMADGGQLHSHGSDWNTGLNYVGNGGSHEENPYDGVPMGIAPDGQPNLVEEGEVIWNNDYVFSNRLKVPKAIRRKYKLGGVKPLTFADAAMKANKEAEERPNDPITLRGRDAILGALAEVQETKRMQKEAREQQEDMILQQGLPMVAANGGHLFLNGTLMPRRWDTLDEIPALMMSNPSLYRQFYTVAQNGAEGKGSTTLHMTNPNYRKKIITDYVTGMSKEDYDALINNIGGKALNYKDNPQGLIDFAYSNKNNRERTPKTDPVYYGIWESYRDKNGPTDVGLTPRGGAALSSLATPPIIPDIKVGRRSWNLAFPRVAPQEDYYPKEAILRYAPVVGSAISVLNDIFGGANRPTGERGNAIREAARGLRDVAFEPVGGYMAPDPLDLDYILNALNGGAGANRDALLNTAGGNRGTAMAGILASDNQYLNAIGNARLAAEKENFERELKRKEFNAKLDEFNKTGLLQAAIRNQGKDEVVAKYLALAADADAQEKLLSNSTISADLTNLFDNLGAVGTDALNRADTRWLARNWPGANAPSSHGKKKVVGYQMGLDGQYIPIYGKNGGKLNKKRRK